MYVRKVILIILLGLFIAVPGWAQNNISNAFINVSMNPQTGIWSCSWKDGTPIFTRATATVVTSTGVVKTTDDRFQRKAKESSFQDALGSGRQIALSLSERPAGLSWRLTLKAYDQFAGLRIDWRLDNSAKSKLDLETVTVLEAEAPSPDRGYPSGVPVLTSGFNSWDYSHVARVRSSEMVHSSDFLAVKASKLVTGFLSAAVAYGTFGYTLRSEHTLTLSIHGRV